MILFKAVHVPMILSGEKTQTRRLWPHGCRAKIGSTHWAQTKMFGSGARFARLHIRRVWLERLVDIKPGDALAEGYPTPYDYCEAFRRINGVAYTDSIYLEVWAVEFEVVHDQR